MSINQGHETPKTLRDVSHLFFSSMEKDDKTAPLPESLREEPPAPLMDPERVKKALFAGTAGGFFGGRIVDGEACETTGADMVLIDGEGRPILLEILREGPETIPFKILSRVDWLKNRRSLFLRAYEKEGLRTAEGASLYFLASSYPSSVIRAAAGLDHVRTRLFTMDPLMIGLRSGLLLREVYPLTGDEVPCTFLPDAS